MEIRLSPFIDQDLPRPEQSHVSLEEKVLFTVLEPVLGECGPPILGNEIGRVRALEMPKGDTKVEGYFLE